MPDVNTAPVQFVLRWLTDAHPLMLIFTAYAAAVLGLAVALAINPYRRLRRLHVAIVCAGLTISIAVRPLFQVPHHTWLPAHLLITLTAGLMAALALRRAPTP
jgi:hypothetical protein